MDQEPRLYDQNDEYYQDLDSYVLARLSYYQCFYCKEPYFGGLKHCDELA